MKTPPAQPSVTARGPLLEAVGLSKSFRPVEVLKDVSLAPGLTGGPSQAQQSTNGHGASPAPERICLRIDSLTMKFVDDAPGTAASGAKRSLRCGC